MPLPTNPSPANPSPTAPAWPPALDQSASLGPFEGRTVATYRHRARAEWGYAADQSDRFLVVQPAAGSAAPPPLYVVLHSAGHDVETALTSGFALHPEGGYDHGLFHPPAECVALYLDCKANPADWWWGWHMIEREPQAYAQRLTPVERRVLDTIEWVVATHGIDRERVYLSGISMGGSGSLGIGLRRGDLFAAMMVWVPAGTKHAAWRVPLVEAAGDGTAPAGIPDPPVVVDCSAQDDAWSDGQETLLAGAARNRYPLIHGWGAFGHVGHEPKIARTCAVALAFPWLAIRRDEAYPVFTGASCDQRPPWPKGRAGGDAIGQINAFFRWQARTDGDVAAAMELRLLRPGEVPSALPFPAEATTDVTLRRLRRFRPQPGAICTWTLDRAGAPVQSGTATVDEAGLVTIPRLRITAVPAVLRITRTVSSDEGGPRSAR